MSPDPVNLLRAFSRHFTQRLGLLDDKPYDPRLTLLESRLVFEVAQAPGIRAKSLAQLLSVDKGHLSRSLERLRKRKILQVANSADRREKPLSLTASGEKLFRKIDQVSRERAGGWLAELGPARAALFTRELSAATLAFGPPAKSEVHLRSLQPGDLGWVIGRHGEVYSEEFGWNAEFEILVAEIALGFARKHDPSRERAWIAEVNGTRLGCVFLVQESAEVAKLRILLVAPSARGLGLGTRLVRECTAFAKKAGYRKLTLWTNDVLHSARRIYEAEGFRLVKEEPHESFGKRLKGQYWEKPLT